MGIEISPSIPRCPQSNGEAERAVQTVKNILKKEKNKKLAMLAYRSTPLSTGYSPVELLMGRKLQNTIPTVQTQLNPNRPDLEHLQKREASNKQQQREHFNIRHQAKKLPSLVPGTEVRITTDNKQGVVLKETGSPKQYAVQTPTATI